jgi:hypothetical protein
MHSGPSTLPLLIDGLTGYADVRSAAGGRSKDVNATTS